MSDKGWVPARDVTGTRTTAKIMRDDVIHNALGNITPAHDSTEGGTHDVVQVREELVERTETLGQRFKKGK